MDFGAKVCVPRPRCTECPLASVCSARPRFAAGEVAEPVRAQSRFAGSDRELRGRLMHALREADAPYDVDALVDATATGTDAARARALLDTLVTDGLAWVREGRVGLGTPPREGGVD
jgi:A/G-specific adenine glycosylase